MDTIGQRHPVRISRFRTFAGIVLIISGAILFLDRYLNTGWLSLSVLPVIGLLLYWWGLRKRQIGAVLAGGIVGGIGLGGMAALIPAQVKGALLIQLGLLALFAGAGWGVVVITIWKAFPKPAWWAMLPMGILSALGICLLFTPLRWVDFVLCLSLGVALPLMIWGVISRLIGLLIPGCLLAGIGPGIYLAWGPVEQINGLTQTGVMLVWFALGWGLITVTGRMIHQRYIWWPFIPGGILAVVGCGLYIGGNPDNALGFISNTGSIGLVIFGLYLLLMRKGIHH